MLVHFGKGQIQCPSSSKLAPCTCTGNGLGMGLLDCSNKNLEDEFVGQVMDAFISPKSLTLLYKIDLSGNKLLRVPNQISDLPQLTYVDLRNNQITIIKTGAFNFAKTLNQLILCNNRISVIEADAFLGNIDSFLDIWLLFEINNLTLSI